jgi:uncharacterized protein (DUF1778 family)
MPVNKSGHSTVHQDARTVRVDARVPLHIKNNLVMAAALSGRTQTDFLITAVNEAAQKVIAEHNLITLCLEDQKLLAQALLDENTPSDGQRWDRLRKAMRRHSKEVDSR